MSEFRQTVAGFRDAMQAEGERSVAPGIGAMLEQDRVARGFRLRWAVAAVVLTLAIGSIPVYRDQQKKREAAQDQSDTLLLEQVNAGLSRSAPPALEPLIGVQ